ncbi:hypothetical protein EXIGLDRAFT_769212 [Exidia glandulosa HHB12029]|uniref:DUF6533 domain-containing protein n=1 Tax=Exidia glandulosa HHB12029 TaxID=1314781 RepID=A0A166AIL9_EXIGL|nr:hypothetical protein EXIGLDRAFT_769212 [Exidia glandulosa HHB12029]
MDADGFSLPPDIAAHVFGTSAFFASVTRYQHVGNHIAAFYFLIDSLIDTAMIYDWLLCFEHEQKLLATPGISPGKLAYLFCRYWPILTYPVTIWVQVVTTDRDLCEKTFQIPLFLTIVNFAGAASVLIVRVYAFTGARCSVAIFLVAWFLIMAAYQIWAVSTQIALVPPIVLACFPVNKMGPAHALSGYFLAPFLFDLMATSMFVWHAFRTKLHLVEFTGAVKLFVQEGAVYFIAISAINLANAIMNLLPQIEHTGVLVAMSMMLPNLLACRLVINLRRAVNDDRRMSGVPTGPTLRFTHPEDDEVRHHDATVVSPVSARRRKSTAARDRERNDYDDRDDIPLRDVSYLSFE